MISGKIREAGRRLQFTRRAATAFRRARAILPRPPRSAILMYHRIAVEAFDPWGLSVSPANFADQLSWLSRERTILSLSDFARLHRQGILPGRAVAITFDDGYACFTETAVPLLDQYRLPATVFLPIGIVETGQVFWWDELQAIVLGAKANEIRVADRRFDLGERQGGDVAWSPGAPPKTPRQTAFQTIWFMLRRKAPAEIESAMQELRGQIPEASGGPQAPRPMSAAQVRSIAGGNVEVGSHALNHPWLATLDTAEKRLEICGSVKRCEALLGSRPVALAYPYGSFDDECERIAAEAGFECACTTQSRPVTRSSRLFALPRIGVPNGSASYLERALALA